MVSDRIKSVTFIVDPQTCQLRLDKALSFVPEIKTRSHATKLIHSKSVLLNGRPVKASHRTSLGEEFTLLIPINESPLCPYDFPLDILFEDAEILVLNKPSGLVVHPAQGHTKNTMVNALISRGTPLSTGSHPMRPGIVHRLDKDTSGVLVVAKSDFSYLRLSEQFKNKTVTRSYWAITLGKWKVSEGTISSYLARHPRNRKKYASLKQGKLSVTHYKNLKTFPSGLSLVECQLETGRTHQIRVHLSEHGHPILGDTLYGASLKKIRSLSLKKLLSSMNRIGLHAFELGFSHPKTKKLMYFRSDWPEDIKRILSKLIQ